MFVVVLLPKILAAYQTAPRAVLKTRMLRAVRVVGLSRPYIPQCSASKDVNERSNARLVA